MQPADAAIQYAQRNKLVAELGMSSYAEYLNSELWQTIRKTVLARDRMTCRCCGMAPATQVHHRRYRKTTLTGHCTHWMVSLCSTCHKRIEFGDAGRKLSPSEADKELLARCKVFGMSLPRVNGKRKTHSKADKKRELRFVNEALHLAKQQRKKTR